MGHSSTTRGGHLVIATALSPATALTTATLRAIVQAACDAPDLLRLRTIGIVRTINQILHAESGVGAAS
jgi:hypothetical protein